MYNNLIAACCVFGIAKSLYVLFNLDKIYNLFLLFRIDKDLFVLEYQEYPFLNKIRFLKFLLVLLGFFSSFYLSFIGIFAISLITAFSERSKSRLVTDNLMSLILFLGIIWQAFLL